MEHPSFQMVDDERHGQMLHDIGEISGVVDMAVIHDARKDALRQKRKKLVIACRSYNASPDAGAAVRR